MSEEPDLPAERAIREVLGARDPGPASPALRTRVMRIPEETGATRRRPAIRMGAVAAALVLLLGGATILAVLPRLAGPASTPSPAPGILPAFDPRAEGVGLAAPANALPWWLGALLVAVAFAMLARGSRRRALRIIAVAAAGAALAVPFVLSQLPGPMSGLVWGPGAGVHVRHAQAELSEYVVVGDEGEPFSALFGLVNAGPVPVRIDGLVDDDAGTLAWRFTGLWFDGEPRGATGPTTPFTPLDLDPSGSDSLTPGREDARALWLVGKAGPCALGSRYDPSRDSAFQGTNRVRIAWSVFGFPRETVVELPFMLWIPLAEGCPA